MIIFGPWKEVRTLPQLHAPHLVFSGVRGRYRCPGSGYGEESDDQLETAASDTREPPSGMAALAQGAQRVVRTLWRLARTFLDRRDLFDERLRGGLLARMLAKLPVIGVARRVARRTRSHS